MVGRSVATTVASGFHRLRALPIALTLAAGLVLAAPGHWFVRVEPIRILPTDQGDIVVVSAHRRWGTGPLAIAWTARIDRLPLGATVGPGETVCTGGGRATIAAGDGTPLRMPLSAWVGDPACHPSGGDLHIAHAQWSFRLFGLTKTTSTGSAAFAALGEPLRFSLRGP